MKRKLLIAAAVLLTAGLAAWAFWPKPWVPYDLSGAVRMEIAQKLGPDMPPTGMEVTDPEDLALLAESFTDLRVAETEAPAEEPDRFAAVYDADGDLLARIEGIDEQPLLRCGGRWYKILGGCLDWGYADDLIYGHYLAFERK